MNTCSTCKWWERVKEDAFYPKESKGGYCKSDKLQEGWGGDECYEPSSLIYSYLEGGSFWTGPEFGCIHHAAKE